MKNNKITPIDELKYKIWLNRYRFRINNDRLFNDFLNILENQLEFVGDSKYYIRRHCADIAKAYVSLVGCNLDQQHKLVLLAVLYYRAKFFMSDGKTI